MKRSFVTMKKLLSILIVMILCVSLVSCGNSGSSDGKTSSGGTSANNSSSSSSTKNDTPVKEDLPEPPKDDIGSAEESQEQPKEEISFDELLAVDNDECSIIITSLDPDNIWGYTIKADLENKSSDLTYMFAVESAAVNGVQCDPLYASEVSPGKKAVANISFSDSNLEKIDVDFSDIELTFRVYDSNDWLADEVARETVHIYPFGEENAKTFIRSPQESDEVIADNGNITATVIGYDKDNIWGYTVELYLQNNTDKEVMFSVDEASVNGYMADPFWATSVLPGKCEFSSMSWFDSTLEEIGVTDIEEIEFLLRAYDADNLMGDDFVNDLITLNP